MKSAAIVLSGCGVHDGTEIHEATSVLIALSQERIKYECFAPAITQHDVINHSTNKPVKDEMRSVLDESARIARCEVTSLSELDVKKFDMLVVPGGYGAAKNLSDFFLNGPNMTVNAELQTVITDFNKANKPIGLCCISPVIAAKCIKGCTVTVGENPGDVEKAITAFGSHHSKVAESEICVDERNKIVTTPAYMSSTATPASVFLGVSSMIKKMHEMIPEKTNSN